MCFHEYSGGLIKDVPKNKTKTQITIFFLSNLNQEIEIDYEKLRILFIIAPASTLKKS